jgi:hypothetical protein
VDSISISKVSIDRDGFVYIMLDYQNRSKMPSFYDVRNGLADFGKNLNYTSSSEKSYFYRSRFEISAKKQLSFDFTGLTHYTNYSIFIYASADDPSYF